mgnify:CR=1 FL=1
MNQNLFTGSVFTEKAIMQFDKFCQDNKNVQLNNLFLSSENCYSSWFEEKKISKL